MGRPREHDEATAVRLLDAAERLLAEHGTGALSVRSVAEAAETSTRAVYALFGSRTGLVDALAARLFDELAAAVDATPRTDDPVADLTGAAVQGFRRIALEHPSLYQLVFLSARSEEDRPRSGHVPSAATALARLEALVGRLPLAAGERGVRDAARAVHALTEGLATAELRGELGPPRQARRVWETAVTALAAGLSRKA